MGRLRADYDADNAQLRKEVGSLTAELGTPVRALIRALARLQGTPTPRPQETVAPRGRLGGSMTMPSGQLGGVDG